MKKFMVALMIAIFLAIPSMASAKDAPRATAQFLRCHNYKYVVKIVTINDTNRRQHVNVEALGIVDDIKMHFVMSPHSRVSTKVRMTVNANPNVGVWATVGHKHYAIGILGAPCDQ